MQLKQDLSQLPIEDQTNVIQGLQVYLGLYHAKISTATEIQEQECQQL